MPGPTSPQQGLDTIPWAVFRDNRIFFETYLPNWSNTGEYNLQVGATNIRLAQQLGLPMQSGPHPWINTPLDRIIKEIKAGPEHLKTPHLVAVAQFMYEASGAEAIASGGSRTGNWIGFASLSDPDLARRAAAAGMSPRAYLDANALTLDKIIGSDAGKDALRINPSVDSGSRTRKLTYDFDEATAPKSGLISKPPEALDPNADISKRWKRPGSTKAGNDWKIAKEAEGFDFSSPDGQVKKGDRKSVV